MNRPVRIVVLAGAVLGFAWTQPAQARSGLQSVIEVRPVELTEEAPFWQNGKQMTVRNTVLIRVKITDTSEFSPTGAGPPLFVFGDIVCQTLRDPLATGEAVLLAPRTPANQPTPLWLTEPGVLEQELTAERVRILRARAQQDGLSRSLQVPALSADVRSIEHRSLSELIRSIR